MDNKKQLSINLVAQLFAFAVGYTISFFLAPLVLRKLGTEAYGFIGLANNFVSYTTFITIALNSMASRFITISFHQGDVETARKYFASVYYSNLFLSIIIALVAIFIVVFLDRMIRIPVSLVWDVKFLFGMAFLNSIFALMSNTYLIATFVKNKLYLSSIRDIMASLLRLVLVVVPFLLFAPHLWYYALSALAATLFLAITNRSLTRKLLPEFKVNKSLYDFKLVRELIVSGGWNVITKLSEILSSGFDLLLANLFISAMAMSVLSISKVVPVLILALCSTMTTVFAPKLTELYAKGTIETLREELFSAIRIVGVCSVIPLIVFIVLGKDFFHLWVPTQDAHTLYILSFVTGINLLIALPQESLWHVFTITNNVKISSLSFLISSIFIFITVLIGVFCFESDYYKLLSIAVAQLIWGGLRSLTFLPIYGAKCLNLKWNTFYPMIFKNIFVSVLIIIVFSILKKQVIVDTWLALIMYAIIISVIAIVWMAFFILDKRQKTKFFSLIKKYIKSFFSREKNKYKIDKK